MDCWYQNPPNSDWKDLKTSNLVECVTTNKREYCEATVTFQWEAVTAHWHEPRVGLSWEKCLWNSLPLIMSNENHNCLVEPVPSHAPTVTVPPPCRSAACWTFGVWCSSSAWHGSWVRLELVSKDHLWRVDHLNYLKLTPITCFESFSALCLFTVSFLQKEIVSLCFGHGKSCAMCLWSKLWEHCCTRKSGWCKPWMLFPSLQCHAEEVANIIAE